MGLLYVLTIFPPENRVVSEITWENIVEPDRSQITTWRMRIASSITKATNTHIRNI